MQLQLSVAEIVCSLSCKAAAFSRTAQQIAERNFRERKRKREPNICKSIAKTGTQLYKELLMVTTSLIVPCSCNPVLNPLYHPWLFRTTILGRLYARTSNDVVRIDQLSASRVTVQHTQP